MHSNGPHVPSGYGVQCNLLVRQLQSLGHEVAVSCFYGLSGAAMKWGGVNLYPSGMADFGLDVLPGHAMTFGADLVITLMDFYKLETIAAALARFPFKIAAWCPIDTNDRIGRGDLATLKNSKAYPVAVSKHGRNLMLEAGLDAHYIPHSIDLSVFHPAQDRDSVRENTGTTGKFVIGINAANQDAIRKSFPEQLTAFKMFTGKHPDVILLLHTLMGHSRGHDLFTMVEDFGLENHVRMSDQYAYIAGTMGADAMAEWYQSLDVLSNASHGEGFGIPLLESQACGVPVVTTQASAMTELCGSGWLVEGEPYWNPYHHAEWVRPSIRKILAAYEKAYTARHSKMYRDKAAAFAQPYEYGLVAREYWKPFLEKVQSDLDNDRDLTSPGK